MKVKPLGGLTKIVVVMICIQMFVLACNILTNIFQLVEYAAYDANYYLDELLVSEALGALVGVVFIVVYIVTAIFFLKWIYRANKNLSILSGRMEFSPGSSIGWYFVPIVNLFKPYQAMREIWRKAHKTGFANTRLLPGWWTLWIISLIFGQIVFRQRSEIVSEYQLASVTMIISDFVDIALGFTAIALISNIGRAYEENYCKVDSDEAEPPTILQEPRRPSDVQINLQGSEEK
ncbi:DUF4328 domain-containing protein [Pontiellaceae bacterium B1224]|nr:DUF4328 domain-containing protein [Pontiellaceae bacterium B1224]